MDLAKKMKASTRTRMTVVVETTAMGISINTTHQRSAPAAQAKRTIYDNRVVLIW